MDLPTSVLEASYIVFRLPPYFANLGKRLVKTPKLYFYDTGFAAALLNVETADQIATHPLRGSLGGRADGRCIVHRNVERGPQETGIRNEHACR